MRSKRESTEERRGLHSEGHVIRFCRLVAAAALAAYLNYRLQRTSYSRGSSDRYLKAA
jgi:hypothetical protein